MKGLWMVMAAFVLLLAAAPAPAAQKATAQASVPKYDPGAEAVFKGTVVSVNDHECPVSGGMGAHVVMKLTDGSTIEVHLATTKWVKDYNLELSKGDEIEVTGVKVKFEGNDAIFARQVKRGNDVFVFRYDNGKPAW